MYKAGFLGIEPRKDAPPQVRMIIQEFGKYPITELYVCRKKVQKVLDKVLNVLSLGQFNKKKNQLGYDDLFHMYLLAKVKIGIAPFYIRIEKNHVAKISARGGLKGEADNDCMNIPLHEPILLSNFFRNGEGLQPRDFWLYDATNNNCQVFVNSLLQGNAINSPALQKFVLQDAASLLSGPLKTITRGVTDIAGITDLLLHGRGIAPTSFSRFSSITVNKRFIPTEFKPIPRTEGGYKRGIYVRGPTTYGYI